MADGSYKGAGPGGGSGPHTHPQDDVVGLVAALAAKAALAHGHVQADVDGLVAALAAKAPNVHTHGMAEVIGLQAALDNLTDPAELGAAITAAVNAHAAGDATDAELLAAIASEVANRDTAIATAVSDLSDAIAEKQDSATAATDGELTAEADARAAADTALDGRIDSTDQAAADEVAARMAADTDLTTLTDAIDKRRGEGLSTKAGRRRTRTFLNRNMFTRPRAVGLTGWDAVYQAASTDTALTEVVDEDLGNCAELTATNAGASAHRVRVGSPSGTYGISVATNQLVFGRLVVKMMDLPGGPCTLQMRSYISNAPETTIQLRNVDIRENVQEGDLITLEGLDVVPSGTGFARFEVQVLTDAPGTVTFRVGKPHYINEPDTEVPEYGDGTVPGWQWAGTANQSASWGFADRSELSDVVLGAQDYDWLQTATKTDVIEMADLCVELGIDSFRLGIIPTEAWPTEGDGPDWTRGVYGEMLTALRERGIEVLAIIGNAPAWMTTTDPQEVSGPHPDRLDPARHDELTELYVALVDQWPDVVTAVQFGNEPNLFWTDALGTLVPNPEFATARQIEMYAAIKATHPDVTFVGPALTRHYLTDAFAVSQQEYLERMYAAGVKGSQDAIGLHPYPPKLGTTEGVPRASTGDVATWAVLNVARQVLIDNDDDIPLWLTEVGIPDSRSTAPFEVHQARFLMCLQRMLAQQPDVDAVFMHQLLALPAQSADLQTFALVTSTAARRRRKLTFYALRERALPDAEWNPVALLNSWVRANAVTYEPGYYVDNEGWCHLRGALKSGSAANATMFNLPEGARPSGFTYGVGNGNGAAAMILITAAGDVNAVSGGSVTTTYLDGIRFKVAA